MNYRKRTLESEILRAIAHFPAILVTGPRRSGKTTLLRHLFPACQHVLLEDPDIIARVQADPRSFLDSLSPPVILDEIQNAPSLFAYIRSRIDQDPARKGRWLLTGSQEAPLMKGVSESMAGRAAVFTLLPFSAEETPDMALHLGGFPEVQAAPEVADIWFRSYVQTYLERDVRAITSIRDLATFRRFMGLLASRCGQMLNKTELAAPLGVSVPTLTQWLSILETTGQIILTPPYFENFGKRLVKTPKLYFTDSGLAASLLGIRTEEDLAISPFREPLFEGLVASEIVKHRLNRGLDRGLYTFRDRQGLEVDFVVDEGNRRLLLIEAKATRTPMPDDGRALTRLASSMTKGNVATRAFVVHADTSNRGEPLPLRPGVKAVGWRNLHPLLDEAT
ncbi:MAG: ATP-binding protein [Kiritimatiellia bacterium]|jgi:predicted AAA+ superfamily ATPase